MSGQDGVSRARMGALPCWPFELSPLNELYRGNRVRSITLVPFEMIIGIHIYQVKRLCHVQE